MHPQALAEPQKQPQPRERRGRRSRLLWMLLALAGGVVIAVVVLTPLADWLRSAVIWVGDLGWIGVLIFAGLYAVLGTLAVPGTPLNLGAGVVFGMWWGFIAALTGGVGAAAISFLLARFLLRDWFRAHLACYHRPRILIERVHLQPWTVLLALRMHPMLPGSVKNYSFGVSDIPLGKYLLVTVAAYVPTTLVYAYLGSAGHMTLDLEQDWTTFQYVLYAVGFVATIAATAVLGWYGRRTLRQIEPHDQA